MEHKITTPFDVLKGQLAVIDAGIRTPVVEGTDRACQECNGTGKVAVGDRTGEDNDYEPCAHLTNEESHEPGAREAIRQEWLEAHSLTEDDIHLDHETGAEFYFDAADEGVRRVFLPTNLALELPY